MHIDTFPMNARIHTGDLTITVTTIDTDTYVTAPVATVILTAWGGDWEHVHDEDGEAFRIGDHWYPVEDLGGPFENMLDLSSLDAGMGGQFVYAEALEGPAPYIQSHIRHLADTLGITSPVKDHYRMVQALIDAGVL